MALVEVKQLMTQVSYTHTERERESLKCIANITVEANFCCAVHLH